MIVQLDAREVEFLVVVLDKICVKPCGESLVVTVGSEYGDKTSDGPVDFWRLTIYII